SLTRLRRLLATSQTLLTELLDESPMCLLKHFRSAADFAERSPLLAVHVPIRLAFRPVALELLCPQLWRYQSLSPDFVPVWPLPERSRQATGAVCSMCPPQRA